MALAISLSASAADPRMALPEARTSFEVSSLSGPRPLEIPGAQAPERQAATSPASASSITITVLPQAEASSDMVRLGDVARIDAADAATRTRLEALPLARSPRFGSAGRLKRSQIQQALGTMPETSVRIAGAEETVVECATMRIDMEALRAELEKRLRAQLPFDSAQIAITHTQLPASIALPKGALKFETRFQLPQRMLGQVPFTGDFLVDGVSAKKISGALTVEARTRALQAIQPIKRGEPLRAEDFRLADLSAKGMPHNAVAQLPGAPANARAEKDIALGTILTEDMIDEPNAVERNDPITLVIQRGTLKVTATAVAREPGSAGDVIRTMNRASGREVMARILDSRTAEVVL